VANKFKVISKKYFNQYRNYDFATETWTLNTTEFTDRLQGNVGETLYLEEEIQVGTIVNEEKGVEQEFISSQGLISSAFYDYEKEGLYKGAAILIEFDGESISGTVEGITNGGTDLCIDSATVTAIDATSWAKDLTRKDVVIKVTTRPEYLLYKYGINQNDSTTPNYRSPLDGFEQSYSLNGITGSFQTMAFSGNEIGSSLGEVQVKFDSTTDSYLHAFTITHEFVVPYYTEGQLSNIQNGIAPNNLKRNSSLKYGNGFFFGGDKNNTTLEYEDLGQIGNIGYYGENFSGKVSEFEVRNYAVSNASNTGKVEVTENNTVTFSIASTPAFTGGETIIIEHSKLPSSNEYANSRNSFESNWVRYKVQQTEGAAATGSTIFSNVTVTLNAGQLDVSFDIGYPPDDQDKLTNTSALELKVTIATTDLSDPDNMNRATISAFTGQPSKDTDTPNLVSSWQPSIYKHSEFDSGTAYTDFNGWDGDLVGESGIWRTDVTQGAYITKAIFRVIADNGTTYFPLASQSIPIGTPQLVTLFGEQFQVLDIDTLGTINIPSGELLNRVKLNAEIPVGAQAFQNWSFSIGFQVPFRDWIENLAVPTLFADYNEPNNNRNEKTSNYSGVSGYDIKTTLTLVVADSTGNTTEYELLSDSTNIDAFGANVGTFTKNYRYFDSNGERDDLNLNEDTRVEIELDHTLGTLTPANLEALVWTVPDQSTSSPFYLSSLNNLLVNNSTLKPTDTLITGNTTLLELDSTLNQVKLIFEVDHTKITSNDQKIYCSLKSV